MRQDENHQQELEHQEQEESNGSVPIPRPNIHQRILAVMREISYIQKEDKMVNDMYRFVSHDAVTAALHPLMVDHGITCLTSVTKHKQDGNRSEASILLTFVNVDNPEDRIEVYGYGHGIDNQDKGPGKAVSYAVKMLLLKTFLLETGDRDNEADLIDHISEERAQELTNLLETAIDALEKGDWATLCKCDQTDGWMECWKKLDTRKKKAIKELIAKRNEYRDQLNTLAEKDDQEGTMEIWNELDEAEKKVVWPTLTDNTKDYLKQHKNEA